MAAVPPDTPVTVPLVPTVAIAVFDDDHVPSAVASESEIVAPSHTDEEPLTAATAGPPFTVTILFTDAHPIIYEISELPALTPVTTPVVGCTVATAGVPELHVPPDTELLSVVVPPMQIVAVPLMAAGMGFTVIVDVDGVPQPVL